MTDSIAAHPIFAWMIDEALPCWASDGWDAETATFVERLTLDGRPIRDAPRRVMVQARQIFVYAVAHRRGWFPGAGALAARAADSMLRLYHRADGAPGFVFSVARDGAVVDATRDLYAHAFVLLGLASAYEVTRDPALLEFANATLRFLDANMASPIGGYLEACSAVRGPRRQNPHMHLFEALLALHAVAPEHDFLDRADSLYALFKDRFLQAEGTILVEFFDDALRPMDGPNYPFEPGHHFEWAFLLSRWAALSARPGPPREATILWKSALRSGIASDGKIFDRATAQGADAASTRLWPYAEAARAASIPLDEKEERFTSGFFLDQLYERFLWPAPAGAWIDRYDESGAPLADFVPASSLYHICGALDAVGARSLYASSKPD
ncbi:MAG: AGE family epimerase/isomerase [Methylocystis sp.]|nr:AGE family epimerase/isomerase [Methylocystis sp.]